MGWDVVEIGLRHDLPVHDPFATAKEVAKRMQRNIRLVYEKEYEFDSANNVVRSARVYSMVELRKFEVNSSKDYLQMKVANYQAQQILDSVGLDKLRKIALANENVKTILSYLEEPFELYEIEDTNEYLDIRIFKENVNLDVSVLERWGTWEYAFHYLDQYREWLRDYRMKIYQQAKLFGCNEVIICADQGPTELIYNNMNFTADGLKEYAHSFQYLEDDTAWVEEPEKEDWKKNAKHIMFSSAFQDQFTLSNEDLVEVIYDDFSDIKAS